MPKEALKACYVKFVRTGSAAVIKIFRDLWRSRLFLETAAEIVFLCFLLLIFPNKLLNDMFNAISIAVWTAVLVSYLPIVLKAMRKPWPTVGERLAAGICAGGVAILISSSVQIYALNFDGQWIYTTAVIPVIRYFVPVAGISHEMAARAIEGRVPTRAMIRLGVTVGCSVLAALALVLVPRWMAGV